jgi:hypothetical protein
LILNANGGDAMAKRKKVVRVSAAQKLAEANSIIAALQCKRDIEAAQAVDQRERDFVRGFLRFVETIELDDAVMLCGAMRDEQDKVRTAAIKVGDLRHVVAIIRRRGNF